MAELSRPDQIPALKTIWAASFPEDSPELIERAFDRLYRPADCMVEFRDDQPVSMAFLLPAVWHNGADAYPVQYIYAAATLPAYRGRGLFGSLLKRAHEEALRRGQAASFLRPGEPSLTAYYRRFGYENWFAADVLRLTREELDALGGRSRGDYVFHPLSRLRGPAGRAAGGASLLDKLGGASGRSGGGHRVRRTAWPRRLRFVRTGGGHPAGAGAALPIGAAGRLRPGAAGTISQPSV